MKAVNIHNHPPVQIPELPLRVFKLFERTNLPAGIEVEKVEKQADGTINVTMVMSPEEAERVKSDLAKKADCNKFIEDMRTLIQANSENKPAVESQVDIDAAYTKVIAELYRVGELSGVEAQQLVQRFRDRPDKGSIAWAEQLLITAKAKEQARTDQDRFLQLYGASTRTGRFQVNKPNKCTIPNFGEDGYLEDPSLTELRAEYAKAYKP